jgi:hypothetical protein
MNRSIVGWFVAFGAVAGCGASSGGAPSGAPGADSGTTQHDSGQGVGDAGAPAPEGGHAGQDAGTTLEGGGGPQDGGGTAKEGGSGSPPAPAAAAGYAVQTLGPAVTSSVWRPFSFFGTNPGSVVTTQNADGSVSVVGGGDDYGAQLSTASATATAPYFSGMAFGGGGYFEITMAIGGPASFWANDVETMAGVTAGDLAKSQWPGQATGFGDWIECDFAEFDTTGVYGFAMHNWYGVVGSGDGTSTLSSGSPASPPGAVYTQSNRYGFLWVPATSTQGGYAKWFFNDDQVGNTITWKQYDPSASPPPSESDATAYAVLDTRHLALILGGPGVNDAGVTNTVHAVSVWQASASNDLVQ